MIEQSRIAVWFQKVRCKLDGNEIHVGVLFCLFCPSLRAYLLYSFIGWQEQQTSACARAFLPDPWHWIPSRSVREPSDAVLIPS